METIGGDLTTMPFQPLSAEHIDILRRIGRERRFNAGEMVAEAGEPQDRLWFVEEGEIELVDPLTDKRKHPTSLGPNQFTGEIAFLSGGSFTLPFRAAKDTRAIEVDREPLLAAMSETPELSDHLITVFAARRRRSAPKRCHRTRIVGAGARRTR